MIVGVCSNRSIVGDFWSEGMRVTLCVCVCAHVFEQNGAFVWSRIAAVQSFCCHLAGGGAQAGLISQPLPSCTKRDEVTLYLTIRKAFEVQGCIGEARQPSNYLHPTDSFLAATFSVV